ncbi:DUF6524 family protein [Nitrococcus mobilis]|uniref:Uncharacterized protein n=1 Tax=Nitrococcus mobilis Nb-231 TaxID=314278 RepID=A4BV33_9GAMM|nr:DUF6524 family protein [Nitrococcus mobilis]EAR20454.1 hypothetical protein NB231_14036 [Nitrococcus mobilis Nb-231]
MASNFSWNGFLIRFVAALILVFATYNPEHLSYFHWVVTNRDTQQLALKVFTGVVLLIGWTVFLRATLRSLGLIGTALAVAFFGTLLWVVIDFGWVAANNRRLMSYLLLLTLTAVLSTGMSWSHIRRRMSGQVDVDDVDE